MKRCKEKSWIFTALFAILILAISALCVIIYKKNAAIPQRAYQKQPISVQVQGAVASPGVYSLPEGSRVKDAVEAAGGVSEKGDADSVNLAAYAEDGMTVTVGEEVIRLSPGNRININTATAEELTALPGIGPVKAQSIVEYRAQIGGFTSVDQLTDVKGIGVKTRDSIKDLIEF